MSIAEKFMSAWRDFRISGLPSSGENNPDKAEIRVIGSDIDNALAEVDAKASSASEAAEDLEPRVTSNEAAIAALAAGSIGVAVVKATQALLFADLAYPANTQGIVWDDPNPLLDGLYIKTGSSGSGAWNQTGLLPDAALRPDLNAEVSFRSARLNENVPLGSKWAATDKDGLAVMVVDASDDLYVAGLRTNRLNGKPFRSRAILSAEFNGFACYGQSWEVSETMSADGAAISTSQPYGSLMFNGGVRPRDAGGTAATQHASLVPLVESTSGNKGESPVFGWSLMVTAMISLEDDQPWDISGYTMIGSSAALSNARLDQLADGTTPFQNLKDDIFYGFTRAQALSGSFVFRAFSWMQSVSDYSASTVPATWKAGLIDLRSDIDAYAKSVTRQSEDVLCILCQPGWAGNYEATDYPWADLTMLDLSLNEPGFVLACPAYFLPKSSDTPHFSAQGNKIRGGYYGIAYKRSLVDGSAFSPLRPLATRRQGTVITVQMNPVGSLMLDTIGYGLQPGYGFSIVTSGGTVVAVSSVSVVSRDTVKIIAATDPGAGAKIRYGFAATGAGGGNIRDSQGDDIVFDPGGLNYPMHNWCVIFEEPLA